MKFRNVTIGWIFILLLQGSLFSQGTVSFSKHTITASLVLAKKFIPVDLDQDGDLDVVAVASNTDPLEANLAWYENDGLENFTAHTITTDFSTARGVYAADLIPGGFLEIVAGSQDNKRITFWKYQTGAWVVDSVGSAPAPNNYSVRVADVNLDGYLDILAAYGDTENRLIWFQGDGTGNFIEHTINSSVYTNAVDIVSGRVDADVDVDVLGGAFWGGDDVSWWENDGTPEDGGWVKHGIQTAYPGANSVELVDIDNDGDLDALAVAWGNSSANSADDRVSWWANDGTGVFGAEQVIVNNFWNARNAKGADVDGDGDMDVVAAADGLNQISWFENDGNQNFTEHIVTNTFTYAYFTHPLDLDGDGDTDIVGSAQDDNEVAWWENQQDDDQLIAAGDAPPASFWSGKVVIDFSAGTADSVTVFYNAGKVPNRTQLAAGIDHLAQKGIYTITTRKTAYTASIDFYYGAGVVDEWSAVDNDAALVICWWDKTVGQWVIAGSSQTVDAVNRKITVNGVNSELQNFTYWTMGSRTPDNPLPVQLLTFEGNSLPEGVELHWSTASETNNLGFEVWRASQSDSQYVLIADYASQPALRGAGNTSARQDYRFLDRLVVPGETYYYKLVNVDFDHQRSEHGPLQVLYRGNASASELARLRTFELGQNYPNPFNSTTVIPVDVPEVRDTGGLLELNIYDMLGRKIKTFQLISPAPGRHLFRWNGLAENGRAVPSGVYLYRVQYNGLTLSRKLQIVK